MSKAGKIIIEERGHYEEIPRDEIGIIEGWVENYYQENLQQRFLQTMVGLPGAGKSVLLRMAVEAIKNDDKYKHKFICNIDISDCADEIEVYFKIARELQTYYRENKSVAAERQQQALNQFMTIHEWLYGKAGEYPAEISDPDKMAEGIRKAVEKLHKAMEEFLQKDDKETDWNNNWMESVGVACKLLGQVTDIIPYVRSAKMLVELVVEKKEQRRLKQLLQATIDAFASLSKREEIMRNLLLLAIPQGEEEERRNPVIILDNFQLIKNNELGRDHTWLSRPGRLMAELNALWIVVSRNSIDDLFRNVFAAEQIGEGTELNGFNGDTARFYIQENCTKILKEQRRKQPLDEGVIEKMLEVCAMEGHDFVGDRQVNEADVYYLPYLLNLVMVHFHRLCEDPAYQITADSFVGLRQQEEFIGYYFYKDLSDLMTNAFQILCCLSTWDDKWIEIVRNRFDNHLLNAKNLLFKTAPMEHLGEDRFKLHEALKDGLYNNSKNYIKEDVLNYLFEEFIRIYGGDEAKNQRELWYQPERLQSFLEIVYKYIMSREAELRPACVKRIMGAMERIYKDNSGRGYVTDGFLRIYSGYIDQLKCYYGIPFVNTRNADFKEDKQESIPPLFEGQGMIVPDIEQAIYYMKCCFGLADLYTNLNISGAAENLEKLCLRFWDCMEQMTDARPLGEVALWQCRRQRIKAMNSIAYDASQEHEYAVAYEYGGKGLALLQQSALAMAELLDVPEEIRLIITPETEESFHVNTCTEISAEVYEKLKEGYKLLYGWSKQELKQGEREKVLQKTFAELLLNEQQNLRGNYPWYCLMLENDQLQEGQLQGEGCWKFGARTYWMRRAYLDVVAEKKDNDKSDAQRKMLKAYHNVCVYLYKTGNKETACVLEHEVLEQSHKMLGLQKDLSIQAQARMEQVKREQEEQKEQEDQEQKEQKEQEKKSKGIFAYLWEQKVGSEEDSMLLKLDPEILEQMQYLGDYYLHMNYYAIATEHFSQVLLSRFIRFGELDHRTLDSLIRLCVASFAHGNILYQMVSDYVQERFEKRVDWESVVDKDSGLMDKIQDLKHIIELGNNYELDEKIVLQKMLDMLEKSGKHRKSREEEAIV